MNLLEFSQLVSSKSMNNELLSKEVALYDVILACFDIKSIKTISILNNNKFEIELSDNDESLAETKRIGSADYGYVNIPSDWVKYTNEEGGNNIQYSDKSVDNAIILNATTRERVGVAEEEDFNEVMAQRFENDLNEINKVVKSWRSTSKVGGNVAIQLNMILESGRYVTCWFFQIDGKMHYIACLGDEKTLAQLTSYVENTWSLDGTGAVTD